MGYQNIVVERRDRIVCVTLNRPEAMNAINFSATAELVEVFREYRDNADEWAMILTGAGEKAFCSGVDMRERADTPESQMKNYQFDAFRPWTDIMQATYKPFICAVNGYCVGGGWHMVADSDIVIGAENAVFMDTHVNVGSINGVESAGLSFKMPMGIVMRMVIEGRHFRVNAQQAYMWGLLSEVVPLSKLMPRAWEIAHHVVEEAAPLAVQGSKKAILGAQDRGPHDGILYAWSVLPEIRGTEDVKEGPRAFAEKRKPHFVGR